MKKLLSTVLALSIGSASAAETTPMTKNFYIKAEAGKSWLESFSGNGSAGDYLKAKPENNFTYGAAIGYKFAKGFRADLNGQVRCLNYKASGSISRAPLSSVSTQQSQNVKSYSLFLNGYYDIINASMFTPYITVGLGYAYNEVNALSNQATVDLFSFNASGKSTSNFAWNVGVGTTAELTKNIDLDITYHYLSLGKVGANATTTNGGAQVSSTSQNIRAHQLTIGVIFKL